jgi:hypothetical protein
MKRNATLRMDLTVLLMVAAFILITLGLGQFVPQSKQINTGSSESESARTHNVALENAIMAFSTDSRFPRYRALESKILAEIDENRPPTTGTYYGDLQVVYYKVDKENPDLVGTFLANATSDIFDWSARKVESLSGKVQGVGDWFHEMSRPRR